MAAATAATTAKVPMPSMTVRPKNPGSAQAARKSAAITAAGTQSLSVNPSPTMPAASTARPTIPPPIAAERTSAGRGTDNRTTRQSAVMTTPAITTLARVDESPMTSAAMPPPASTPPRPLSTMGRVGSGRVRESGAILASSPQNPPPSGLAGAVAGAPPGSTARDVAAKP